MPGTGGKGGNGICPGGTPGGIGIPGKKGGAPGGIDGGMGGRDMGDGAGGAAYACGGAPYTAPWFSEADATDGASFAPISALWASSCALSSSSESGRFSVLGRFA